MPIQKMVQAVNRTLGQLDAMYDGQPVVLIPGYKVVDDKIVGAGPGGSVATNPLPYFAAEMVKRQNPVMGTEDPENPKDFDSLIGIVEWDDDIDHIEQSAAEERLDRELLDDEGQKGKSVKTIAGRRGARAKKKQRNKKNMVDEKLRNPMGIRADYN